MRAPLVGAQGPWLRSCDSMVDAMAMKEGDDEQK
jgi:hypothetical protein